MDAEQPPFSPNPHPVAVHAWTSYAAPGPDVERDKLCPICGSEDHQVERGMRCMRRTDGLHWCLGAFEDPGPWTRKQLIRGDKLRWLRGISTRYVRGGLLVPIDDAGDDKIPAEKIAAPDLRTEREVREDRIIEESKAKQRSDASAVWKQCQRDDQRNHQRVRDYLAARGLRLDDLPPAVLDNVLRYHPSLYRKVDHEEGDGKIVEVETRCPAMVAPVLELVEREPTAECPRGALGFELSGVHRTFLHAELPAKSPVGDAKMTVGVCSGRQIWLSRNIDSGMLILTEGIETALACLAAVRSEARSLGLDFEPAVAAGISAESLAKFVHPPALFAGPHAKIRRVIIAADLDAKCIAPQHQLAAAKRIQESVPGIDVERAKAIASLPTGERMARWLQLRLKALYPALDVRVSVPTPEIAPSLVVADDAKPGGYRPAGKLKGVDWLDVYVQREAAPGVPGPMAVAMGMSGPDPLAALSVPPLLAGSTGPKGVGTNVGKGGGDLDRASREFRDDGSVGRNDGAGAGGGRGNDDDGGGDDPEPLEPWRPGNIESYPVIEDDPVIRARRFLWERCRVPRAGRFGLVYWAGKWWMFNRAAYEEVQPSRMQAIVLNFLQDFAAIKRKRAQRLGPTPQAAKAVMESMVADTFHGGSVNEVMDPVIGSDGAPLWGSAAEVKRPKSSDATGVYQREKKLVFPNGVLPLGQLANGDLSIEDRIKFEKHTPDFFATTCLKFKLNTDDVRELLSMADIPRHGPIDVRKVLCSEGADALFSRVCPHYWRWMNDAFDDPDEIAQLCLMQGDAIAPRMEMHKIMVVVGVKRGGKGIIESANEELVGARNVAALTGESLTDRFGISHLVGKPIANLSDAHFEGLMNAAAGVEKLKIISGHGLIPIRGLYQETITIRLDCRPWIFCNLEPALKDHSGALAGRFVWLVLRKTAFGREDQSIRDNIPIEAPGIMLFALLGAMALERMARREIPMAAWGRKIAEKYGRDSAPVDAFVADCLGPAEKEADPSDEPTHEGLYELYKRFSEKRLAREPLSKSNFERAVKFAVMNAGLPWSEYQPTVGSSRVRRLRGLAITDHVDDGSHAPSAGPAHPSDAYGGSRWFN